MVPVDGYTRRQLYFDRGVNLVTSSTMVPLAAEPATRSRPEVIPPPRHFSAPSSHRPGRATASDGPTSGRPLSPPPEHPKLLRGLSISLKSRPCQVLHPAGCCSVMEQSSSETPREFRTSPAFPMAVMSYNVDYILCPAILRDNDFRVVRLWY